MKTFWADFKKFITKGNVLDLAVATIIGASFTTISTTFTQGIIMPLVNLLFKVDLSTEYLVLKEAVYDPVDPTVVVEAAVLWRYGDLIQAVINFLIIALFLFILVKVIVIILTALLIFSLIMLAIGCLIKSQKIKSKFLIVVPSLILGNIVILCIPWAIVHIKSMT